MKKICAFFSILICLLLGVVSCKPSLPGDVLSKGKMADILYDYHVALSMAHTADGGIPDRASRIARRCSESTTLPRLNSTVRWCITCARRWRC